MTERTPLYRNLANEYRSAIESGALRPGERFPSVRALMGRHEVSLSTALQVCRTLETEGWLEARPRSGNFVRRPRRAGMPTLREPSGSTLPDPAQFVGIHARVSHFIARGKQVPVKINLSTATCAPDLYPADALKNAATRALRRHPELLVRTTSLNGSPVFRNVLARRALESGMVLSPDEIVVTHGCIEALNIALRAVTQPGDIVAVESPTFFGLLQVLESLGLRALEIPTSPQTGLSLEALELARQTYPDLKALVVVPVLQNPLGSVMPDAHKERLVAFCEAAGIAVIEDDTYSALANRNTAGDSAPKALKHWDKTGNVIHCASLHKILAAGMRLGWMSAGRWQARVEMLKYAQTRSSEELSQLAAAEFMGSSAYDRHLRRLRTLLDGQRAQTATLVAQAFPEGTRLNEPDGGVMLWLELPAGTSSATLFDAALAEGILIAPGQMFSNSNRFDNYLRLNCGFPFTSEVEAALRRLGQLARQSPGRV
jgi:DNA-binding transcriptional MocR family regulator